MRRKDIKKKLEEFEVFGSACVPYKVMLEKLMPLLREIKKDNGFLRYLNSKNSPIYDASGAFLDYLEELVKEK